MAERNLIGEGFVTNTLAPDGSVSGTQTVSIPEINNLVDDNFSTTALTISGTFFTSLDADLGARWKLSRVDLYTDEVSNANFDMSFSIDGVDFVPITMTGAAGLWQGPVFGTAVSGAPRYVRYEHNAPADRIVREWRAINDDTLVNFGTTGTQTEVEVGDAPIGGTSAQVTTLPLFNSYTKTAQGFVFIDETGNKGDNNIEISTKVGGPWFGRRTQPANQPGTTPWFEEDPFGNPEGAVFEGTSSVLTSLRTVSGTAYRTDFSEGLANGWDTSGFTSFSITSNSLQGVDSTSTTPSFKIDNDFGDSAATSPDSVPTISNDFLPFRAQDYNTVQVSLTTPTLFPTDRSEGPRLFWRDHTDVDYDLIRSTVSTIPGANFIGTPQIFTFDVGAVPTWSGVIRSFKVQNYTTATGLGLTSSLNSLDVFYGERGERLALSTSPVISGSFIALGVGTLTGIDEYRTVINTENPIKEQCIITSVSATLRPQPVANASGWFLVRFANGFTYNDRADEVNAFGNPFEVIHFVVANDTHIRLNQVLFTRESVLWNAEPGDMIGFGYRTFAGAEPGEAARFVYNTDLTTTSGGGLAAKTYIDIENSQTNVGLSSELNGIANWQLDARKYNVQFSAVSAGNYVANGIYTTPVFDGGGEPALLSSQHTAITENGTSIDVSGSTAFDAVEARADVIPPNTSTDLGRRINQFALGAHPSDNPSAFNPQYTSEYIIGLFNEEVTGRENSTGPDGDTSIENFAMSVLYHETKQELWLLNVLISGTQSSDMRPTWDAYDLTNGDYLRTQHVTGNITYFHTNNGVGAVDSNTFEPVGWVADYDREEIYVISREDEFSVGAGTYNGLILDLDGEFKDVFWRSDQLTQDLVDAGLQATVADAERYLQNMRTVAYRAPYFYSITSGASPSSGDSGSAGVLLQVYRLGNNPSDPENVNDVEFISNIDLTLVSGFAFISVARPVETFTYCSANDLFYFTVRGENEIHTMTISQIGVSPTETFVAAQGPISEILLDQIGVTDELIEGYSRSVAGSNNNWSGAGVTQQLKHFVDWTYVPDRDSFVTLLNYRSNRSRDFVRNGAFSSDYFLFRFHNHSMIAEVAAGTQGAQVTTPKFPSFRDAVWGTLSGTLLYDQVQENSILFPTGRYAQLRYSFNSDNSRSNTPYLVESRVAQGIRVADIPVAGTKNIFLRTNIPEDEVIGDQTGKLKVFWELEAN
jgi:hypothetical protein